MTAAPIIITATMAASDFIWANTLRRKHFPPERNVIDAHITLFHHLPPMAEAEILQRMKMLCRLPPPPATLVGVLNLGRGVAFRLESPALLAMRQELAEAFAGLLTPQDQQKPRLHITIQNKVDSATARMLFDELTASFHPRAFGITGLTAWRYLGGPWELIRAIPFRG